MKPKTNQPFTDNVYSPLQVYKVLFTSPIGLSGVGLRRGYPLPEASIVEAVVDR